MDIEVNGQPRSIDAHTSIADLLAAMGYGDKRVAVEVNRQIITRSAHATHVLQAGDVVEIVHAIGGG
ncbi:sulfur carrier protein ThiS [bacterium]|nr:sulfur carrier protein ThiS [bacterium]